MSNKITSRSATTDLEARPSLASFSSRRLFLKQLSLTVGAFTAAPLLAHAAGKKVTILVRSSWQTVNIGDIGHTPGVLTLLYRYLPEAEIILWPTSVDHGVAEMLLKNFPKLQIAKGNVDKEGKPQNEDLKNAFEKADFLLHGSGPYVVAEGHVEAWRKQAKKPYGIYGVSIGEVSPALKDLIDHAAFIFCRDTDSLKYLKEKNVACPIMEFAPDATFGITLRDDAKADSYLKSVGLEAGKFICVIPRLRYTPYWKVHGTAPTESDKKTYATSQKYQEVDHAKLRTAIVKWVENTGLKVLACPEMNYQVELAKEVLVDPLSKEVKENVVWRDSYWNPDEAGSIYARSLAIISIEMHSPIIAAAMGVPAIHVRQPTDTRKGQMWRDIGLSEWLFEIDQSTGEQIADTLMSIYADYPKAKAKLKKAMGIVEKRQRNSMKVLRNQFKK